MAVGFIDAVPIVDVDEADDNNKVVFKVSGVTEADNSSELVVDENVVGSAGEEFGVADCGTVGAAKFSKVVTTVLLVLMSTFSFVVRLETFEPSWPETWSGSKAVVLLFTKAVVRVGAVVISCG